MHFSIGFVFFCVFFPGMVVLDTSCVLCVLLIVLVPFPTGKLKIYFVSHGITHYHILKKVERDVAPW